ncbi:MAG: hypothetical protein R3E42_10690 [Burkholderiaceae bacterium]
MMTPGDIHRCAETIWAARCEGRTLNADETLGPNLTLAEAYAVQRELVALRVAAGERIIGWKLGYTSEVMRRQMGIDRPNFGPLTDRMLLGSGDAVDERLVQPRVEPEIGLRLATPSTPGKHPSTATPWPPPSKVPTPASKSCTPPGPATASTSNKTPPTTRPLARWSSARACP